MSSDTASAAIRCELSRGSPTGLRRRPLTGMLRSPNEHKQQDAFAATNAGLPPAGRQSVLFRPSPDQCNRGSPFD